MPVRLGQQLHCWPQHPPLCLTRAQRISGTERWRSMARSGREQWAARWDGWHAVTRLQPRVGMCLTVDTRARPFRCKGGIDSACGTNGASRPSVYQAALDQRQSSPRRSDPRRAGLLWMDLIEARQGERVGVARIVVASTRHVFLLGRLARGYDSCALTFTWAVTHALRP